MTDPIDILLSPNPPRLRWANRKDKGPGYRIESSGWGFPTEHVEDHLPFFERHPTECPRPAVIAEPLDLDVVTVNLKDAIVEAIWDGDWKQQVAGMDIENVMSATIRAVLEAYNIA